MNMRNTGEKQLTLVDGNYQFNFHRIKEEHEAVRTKAGLFDVSHMGEIFVAGDRCSETIFKN